MFPRTQSQFFEGSIHLIFAVVVAQGFTTASQIFVPISNVIQYDGMISALSLIFAYFFLATSWIGFYKSVKEYPHKENKKGILRYTIAILITFLTYYMINLTSTNNASHYGETFTLVPIIFGIITFAHFIKYLEYQHELAIEDPDNKKLLRGVIFLSITITGITIAIGAAYDFAASELTQLNWDGESAWNPIFIGISILLILWYRYKMWSKYKRIDPTKTNAN